jgi:hypothetical protein
MASVARYSQRLQDQGTADHSTVRALGRYCGGMSVYVREDS